MGENARLQSFIVIFCVRACAVSEILVLILFFLLSLS